jgi:putative ABC transport system permease protein
MNEIFGVPMNSIMVVLLVMLGICLLVVAWVALRRTLLFKMGLRNVPRRPAQTVLVVVGLMLSTLIIAAAFGTGDTIDNSVTSLAYNTLGPTDELVLYSNSEDGEANINGGANQTIPAGTVQRVDTLFEGTGLIHATMPMLFETVPVFLFDGAAPANAQDMIAAAQEGRILQAEPSSNLVGIDPAQADEFGGLKSVDGSALDLGALPDDQIIISETMADKLGAKVGDSIGYSFGNVPLSATVAAIAKDSLLSGQTGDNSTPGMVMPLDRLQAITDNADQISMVAISNTGTVRDSLANVDEIVDKLKAEFAGDPIGVNSIKQDTIDSAELASSAFTTLFVVFGLFSIGVGILLIILIFSMLAAERRSEMGMARAVGAQRAQLVHQFLSEGTVYALLAGLVGAFLGIGAAYLIAFALGKLFGDLFDIEPYVSPRSMVVAYCLGVVITFIAVVYASIRNSRLNIVAAIRDIPDVSSPVRKKRTLVFGALALIIGALLTFAGLSGNSAFAAYAGLSILPFGIALFLRYFGISSRLVYSIVSIYLIVLWLLPDSVSTRIFGELNGDIEMFFLSGVFLVAGATMLIVQNLDVLLGLVNRIGGLFGGALPSVRTAIAFPGATPSRTGMTIAMFSLIIFSLVMFSTINENFSSAFLGDEANAGWDVRADQGGANPIGTSDDFQKLLQDRGFDTSQISAVGMGTTGFGGKVRREGGDWGNIFIHGMDEGLIADSAITFQQRAEGFPDDASVIEALKTRDDVAVIDASALAGQGGFGGAVEDPFTLKDPDGEGPQTAVESGDDDFAPVTVDIEGPGGSTVQVQIIGIIDSKISSLIGLFAPMATMDQVLPTPSLTSYFIQLNDPGQSEQVAKEIEQKLLINGVQAVSIKNELEDFQSQARSFLYIFQGFMGLGLIVGLAAIGVIAFRAVVERRQQIGVLRAIGFQSRAVSLSFLIETGFIVLLGCLSGTILGLLLARNLFAGDEFVEGGVSLIVPWVQIIVILLLTFVASLLMTLIPARQASKLAPAEALRYE